MAYESGLQHALNGFAAACNIAGMTTSSSKTEILYLSRNPAHFFLQVAGVSLRSITEVYVTWGSHSRVVEDKDEELDVRSGKASAIMRALHHSLVLKREISRKAKL